MRKIILLLFVTFLLSGCKDKVLNNSNIEMVNSKGMKGKPEYMYFVNPQEGYLFNYITESEDQTEDQLNDPNFFPKSTDISTVFRTTDGGKNWVKVFSIKDYSFYNTAFCDGNNIFIKIIDSKEVLKNKLLKFELNTKKYSILNFNFEIMGEIWSIDQKVFIDSKNDNISNIYITNANFTKLDSIEENRAFQDKVTLLEKKPYALTWNNEIYDIQNKKVNKIDNIKPECIVKKDNKNLLIAGKKDSSIILLSYNVSTKQDKYLKEFEGYSIVQGLQGNDKVICGFIGNIKGAFTVYDLFYSLDQGKTWQIQKLKEKSYVRPNCLIDNILYIYSGGGRIQKITLK